MIKRLSFFIFTGILLSSCTHNSNLLETETLGPVISLSRTEEKHKDNKPVKIAPLRLESKKVKILSLETTLNEPLKERILLQGTKNQALLQIFRKLSPRELKKKVQLKVENITLRDLITLLFHEILKLNYKIIPSKNAIPNTPIDLNLNNNFTLEKFLKVAFTIFELHGIIVKYDKLNDIFLIEKVPTLVGNLPVIIGDSVPTNYSDEDLIVFIYPVKTDALSENYNTFTKFFIPPGMVVSFSYGKRFLIASGSAGSIRSFLKIAKFFDKPSFNGKKLLIFDVNHFKPSDFVLKLQKLLVAFNIPVTDSPKNNGIFLMPLDTASKVLAVVPQDSLIPVLEKLVKELDYSEVSVNKELLFFEPQNRSAEDIYSVLSEFKKFLESSSKQKKKISIILDKARNQIIVRAPKEDIAVIKNVLERLDKAPKQVLVEVTIAEITLKDQLEYGLEWYLKHSGYWQGTLSTVLGLGANGFSYSLITSTDKFRMLLNAFAKRNLINILSSPHLVVLSGKKASITVGTEVPVITSEVSASDIQTNQGPSILRNVTYKSTGVQLSIEPIVSSKGMVELVISQQVSEAQTNNISNIDSPLILNRSISTDVFVKSGQTVILGGLISETKSKSKSEVPILGDMPIIGNLFSASSNSIVKTELIVMITPYILNDPVSYRQLSKEIIEKVSKTLHLRGSAVGEKN